DGAAILVDGKRVGRAPVEDSVFVMPGRREVQAQLAGFEAARELVEIDAGETLDVSLRLAPRREVAPEPEPLPAPRVPADEGPSAARMGLGITALVLGAGGLATGIALVVLADQKGDDAAKYQAQVDAAPGVRENP